jgi:hypothetical protein
VRREGFEALLVDLRAALKMTKYGLRTAWLTEYGVALTLFIKVGYKFGLWSDYPTGASQKKWTYGRIAGYLLRHDAGSLDQGFWKG